MKHSLLGFALLVTTTLSFASTGLEYAQGLVGDHQLNCGTVKFTLQPAQNDANLWIAFPDRTFIIYLRANGKDEGVKLSGQKMSYSHEETDNAWPNLKDWEKTEVKIEKDEKGELASISYRSGWGKPFYLSSVRKQKCTK